MNTIATILNGVAIILLAIGLGTGLYKAEKRIAELEKKIEQIESAK